MQDAKGLILKEDINNQSSSQAKGYVVPASCVSKVSNYHASSTQEQNITDQNNPE